MSEMMIANSLVKIKETPPYTPELEVPVLMNSMARASLNPKTGSYVFPGKLATRTKMDLANVAVAADASGILSGAGSAAGIGVDQGKFRFLDKQ
jgi:fatty acid synthase subunit alpha